MHQMVSFVVYTDVRVGWDLTSCLTLINVCLRVVLCVTTFCCKHDRFHSQIFFCRRQWSH